MRPRWVEPATLVLSIAGVVVSTYLTVAHYTSPKLLACSASGLVNCERVTTSQQSTVLGIPVAVIGLAWFLVITALCAPSVWRPSSPAVHTARLAAVISSMGFVVWLVYAELWLSRYTSWRPASSPRQP